MGEERDDNQRRAALERMVAADPRSLAFVSLAEDHVRAGEFALAVEVAQRGLLAHPDSVAGRLVLAEALAAEKKVKPALEQLKRALVIDQENTRALTLMGKILLDKGLAARAVQFLSHAARLSPDDAAVQAKLLEAQAAAAQGASDPWEGAGAEDASQAHTVFAGEEGQARLDAALERLGSPVEADPTTFDVGPGETLHDTHGPGEGPTIFEGERPSAAVDAPAKPKMGGSAAELSKMMGRAEVAEVQAAAEARVLRPERDVAGGVTQPGAKAAQARAAAANAAKKEQAKEKAAQKKARAGPDAARQDAARKASSSASSKKAAKRAAEPPSSQKARRPSAVRAVGPAATRMVDDALWALFGQRSAPAASAEGAAPVVSVPDAQAGAKASGQVVRTSARLGVWTRLAALLVAWGTVGVWGYSLGFSRGGGAPEQAAEELKGVAADLERGGLAALLAVEEKVAAIRRDFGDLGRTLDQAEAEAEARRFADFGGPASLAASARTRLRGVPPELQTVEGFVAEVLLSTSAAARASVESQAARLVARHPRSPKLWTAVARFRFDQGQATAAADALHKALRFGPDRRDTRLLLAERHVASGRLRAAALEYEAVLDAAPLDVRAAVQHFLVERMSDAGVRPDSRAAARLGALIREESAQVAKYESGRARVAVALAHAAFGRYEDAATELAAAEGAYPESIAYRGMVADLLFAVGAFKAAQAAYEAFATLPSAGARGWAGYARASVARARHGDVGPRARGKRRRDGRPLADLTLPYGRLELRPTAFDFARARWTLGYEVPGIDRCLEGAPDEAKRCVDAAVALAKARSAIRAGALPKARAALRSATAFEGPERDAAMGRLALASGGYAAAKGFFERILAVDEASVPARMGMAEAEYALGQLDAAMHWLSPVAADRLWTPRGLLLVAKIQMARGAHAGAILPLERLLGLQPESKEGRVLLGEAFHHAGQPEKATALFEALRPLLRWRRGGVEPIGGPALSPVALAYLGCAMLESDPRRARRLLQASVRGAGAPAAAHFWLGRSLLARRRTRAAGRKALKKYLAAAPGGVHRGEALRLLRKR